MEVQIANYYYQQLLGSEESDFAELQKYKQINDFLKSNDWLFISPFFFQGYELDIIQKLKYSSEPVKDKILELVNRKFYDLQFTASFLEGYCIRCDYIKPFLKSIESSLILCFQKDYEGSIKTIITIIEGILRKYLIVEKSFTNERIHFKDLINSFENLKNDLVSNYIELIKNYKTENQELVEFSEIQIEKLTTKKTEYYNVWFSFVKEFINESFYLKTNGNIISNEVNRHSILHELGYEFKYNFENYVKIYFLLQFLTWIFIKKERKSIFNGIDSVRFYEKIRAYEKIIEMSEKMTFEKHTLLKNYENYDDSILKQNFPKFENNILPTKYKVLNNITRKFEEFLWRKYT